VNDGELHNRSDEFFRSTTAPLGTLLHWPTDSWCKHSLHTGSYVHA